MCVQYSFRSYLNTMSSRARQFNSVRETNRNDSLFAGVHFDRNAKSENIKVQF